MTMTGNGLLSKSSWLLLLYTANRNPSLKSCYCFLCGFLNFAVPNSYDKIIFVDISSIMAIFIVVGALKVFSIAIQLASRCSCQLFESAAFFIYKFPWI